MTATTFYLDLLLALGIGGASAAAGAIVVERRLSWLSGSPRVLAHGTTITAALLLAHLVPGALGILSRGSVAAAAAALLAVALLAVRRVPAAREQRLPAGAGPLEWALAAAAVIAVAATVLGFVRIVGATTLTGLDGTVYQVPTVARWIQESSVWGIHQFVADYSNGTYPMHGNLLLLGAVLPWDRAFLTNLVPLPFFVLACVAAYALARELAAPRPAAALAAAAFAAVPVLSAVGAGSAQTDLPALAALGTAMVFGLRHAQRPRRAELVLAAVALGLAVGTKWYGLPYAALLLAAWAVAALARRRGARRVARDAGLVIGVAALAGGFWMLRNWIKTGNPLFPVKVELGGLTIFDAPRDLVREKGGFTLLHYATDVDVWREYLWPTFRKDFALPALAIVLGALAALAMGLRAARHWPVVATVAVAAALALLYAATPYSAFGGEGQPILASASTRYGLPALLAAAAAAAWALGRAGPLRVPAGLAALAVTLAGLASHYELSARQTVAGLVLALMAGAVLWAAPRVPWRLTWVRATAAAALLLVGFAATEKLRARMDATSYARFDPVYATIENMRERRVAIAGTVSLTAVAPTLPAFTPSLRNHVVRLGRLDGHLLRGFRSRAPFQAALSSGDHDLLLVARGNPPVPQAREEIWAQELGWRPVIASRDLALLLPPRSR